MLLKYIDKLIKLYKNRCKSFICGGLTPRSHCANCHLEALCLKVDHCTSGLRGGRDCPVNKSLLEKHRNDLV